MAYYGPKNFGGAGGAPAGPSRTAAKVVGTLATIAKVAAPAAAALPGPTALVRCAPGAVNALAQVGERYAARADEAPEAPQVYGPTSQGLPVGGLGRPSQPGEIVIRRVKIEETRIDAAGYLELVGSLVGGLIRR